MTQTNKQTNEKGSRFAVQTKLTENLTFQLFYFIITNILPLTFFKRSVLLPYFYETSIPFFRSIDYNSADTKIYIQIQSILHFSRLSFMPWMYPLRRGLNELRSRSGQSNTLNYIPVVQNWIPLE